MLLMIDNYDSFTYNLVQYFQTLKQDIQIYLNDQIDLSSIESLKPSAIIISPGPKSPIDAGISLAIIEKFHQHIPILGICLGHQAIAHAFGGKVIPSPQILHGKSSSIFHHQHGVFYGLPTPLKVIRYHSLLVETKSLPTCFSIDAMTNDYEIMAISHHHYPLYGLQFHPESFLTQDGLKLLANFLDLSTQFSLRKKHEYQRL